MTTQKPKVGFIGLGLMGYPMAKNLANADFDLTVHNRSPEKAERLSKDCGCNVAPDIKALARESDIIITMLPGPSEVEDISGEIITEARSATLLVDMSTSSPALAKELSELALKRSMSVLDAPVSGGDVGAIDGTLSIMVGGEEEDFRRAKPLFDVMGKTVTHVGKAGAGQIVKAANQIVVALTIEAVSEALVLAEKGGVKPDVVLDVLGGGLASNKVMEVKRDKFISGEFEPGGKVTSHHKDLGIALESGREYGVALPVTAVVDQMFASLVANGDLDLDHSALIKVIRSLSGE